MLDEAKRFTPQRLKGQITRIIFCSEHFLCEIVGNDNKAEQNEEVLKTVVKKVSYR